MRSGHTQAGGAVGPLPEACCAQSTRAFHAKRQALGGSARRGGALRRPPERIRRASLLRLLLLCQRAYELLLFLLRGKRAFHLWSRGDHAPQETPRPIALLGLGG